MPIPEEAGRSLVSSVMRMMVMIEMIVKIVMS
jgi:hypothetical protein